MCLSFSRSCAFVLLLLFAAMAEPLEAESESLTIPLSEIWALSMPGTTDIRELEPDKFGWTVENLPAADKPKRYKHSLIGGIVKSLSGAKRDAKARPGFAVLGIGSDALQAAHAVIANGKDAPRALPHGEKVSIVFFSRPSGVYVHIHKIERQGNSIRVRYRVVPHETREITTHFALIPVTHLLPGNVNVEFVRSPMQKKFVDAGFTPPDEVWESRTVGRSFQFQVN